MVATDINGQKKSENKSDSIKKDVILLLSKADSKLEKLKEDLESAYNLFISDGSNNSLKKIGQKLKEKQIHLILSNLDISDLNKIKFTKERIDISPHCKWILITKKEKTAPIRLEIPNNKDIYRELPPTFQTEDLKISIRHALELYKLEEKNRELSEQLQETMNTLEFSLSRQTEAEKMAMLGGFVAGIVHDANTPIGITVTAASHLEEKTKHFFQKYSNNDITRSDLESYIKIVQEVSCIIMSNQKRASELMQSFKDIAVDQSSNDCRKFKLLDYINETLLSLQPKLKRTKHTIRMSCPEELEITSYPGAFSQIVTNLVINSLIHGFEDMEAGEIVIDIFQEEEILVFQYKDNGRGIENKHLEKIFEPFFTTKKAKGGSGIGTHIIHSLVTKTLHGTISCSSELGKGTSFLIKIPLDDTISEKPIL